MKILSYIRDRLKEPGSIRSLALFLWIMRSYLPAEFAGLTVDEMQLTLEGMVALLAGYSFLKPEAKNTVIAPDVVVVKAEKHI